MSLVFYILGIVTGLTAYRYYGRPIRNPKEEHWIAVNGQSFSSLEAACEFVDWLENHGYEIEFSVRDAVTAAIKQ